MDEYIPLGDNSNVFFEVYHINEEIRYSKAIFLVAALKVPYLQNLLLRRYVCLDKHIISFNLVLHKGMK